MANNIGVDAGLRVVITREQIIKRVHELARQISDDYRGKTICAVCVMENAFVFMADLVRELEAPILCQFIRPDFNETSRMTEIFFSPESDVTGQDVLLVEALIDSGVTTEFLVRNLLARGARSVKVAAFLDRQSARKVSLQPDYFGFLVDDSFVIGYGLGSPHFGRNLPYVASAIDMKAAQHV